MNKLFLEKVKIEYNIVELVKCSVIFSLEHSKELRKILLTKFCTYSNDSFKRNNLN